MVPKTKRAPHTKVTRETLRQVETTGLDIGFYIDVFLKYDTTLLGQGTWADGTSTVTQNLSDLLSVKSCLHPIASNELFVHTITVLLINSYQYSTAHWPVVTVTVVHTIRYSRSDAGTFSRWGKCFGSC